MVIFVVQVGAKCNQVFKVIRMFKNVITKTGSAVGSGVAFSNRLNKISLILQMNVNGFANVVEFSRMANFRY